MFYQIEKKVPIAGYPTGENRRQMEAMPLQKMKVGDSFLVPFEDAHSVRSTVFQHAIRAKQKYQTRKTEFGVRVWRIK